MSDLYFTSIIGHDATKTYYLVALHEETGQCWDQTNGALAAAPDYSDMVMAEGSDQFNEVNGIGAFRFTPPAEFPAGTYLISMRQQAGGSPDVTDNEVRAKRGRKLTANGVFQEL